MAGISITFFFDRPVRMDSKASDGKSHCTGDVRSVQHARQDGREGRHNPRRTTSTTWFIVAPMYLLIKHRIDLSPAPAAGKNILIIDAARLHRLPHPQPGRDPHLRIHKFIYCALNYLVSDSPVCKDIKYRFIVVLPAGLYW